MYVYSGSVWFLAHGSTTFKPRVRFHEINNSQFLIIHIATYIHIHEKISRTNYRAIFLAIHYAAIQCNAEGIFILGEIMTVHCASAHR